MTKSFWIYASDLTSEKRSEIEAYLQERQLAELKSECEEARKQFPNRDAFVREYSEQTKTDENVSYGKYKDVNWQIIAVDLHELDWVPSDWDKEKGEQMLDYTIECYIENKASYELSKAFQDFELEI